MSFQRIWHKNYPSGIPAEIDFDRITMPEALTRSASRFPDNPALIYFGTVITYRELESLVNRFAKALRSLGVKKGDKVSMILPNIPQIVIAEYAAFRIGAVNVMNNPLYTEHELAHQLNDSESTVLVTLDLFHPVARKLQQSTGAKKAILCGLADYLPEPLKPFFPPADVPPAEGVYKFMDLIGPQPDDPVKNEASLEDLGALIYTGGTTGLSKGVMLSHANISFNAQQFRSWFVDSRDGEERTLAIFPFFHAAGWTGLQNTSIYAGWADVLVPRPEPDRIMDLLEKFKPTFLPGVSTIFVALLNSERFQKMDLSFVKAYLTGSAPMAVETIKMLKDRRNVPLVNVYGLTEITPMGTATPWGGDEKPGTVGIPFPNTDLKIVDLETGKTEVKQGEAGEICFKGPQVMMGYYKNPEETSKVLVDGWLYTGDIGVMDEDGYVTIVDRKKDMILASGFNIYPKEIDELLMTHPKVLEVCTIGVPDAYRGETVKTFVVVKPGQTMTEEDVTSFCRQTLAAYKIPKMVEFLETLPKSAVGKILRRELRDLEMKKMGKA
ncbi:MAG: long-chain fatty acid--CoA ligase [Deltaproteobacteria bacterium HGW-Deltaproteobacteria-19]|jgi:long-chain acyl-CoA synthetase|nr:MAG: long-chain fatty acid--CoA ligase [Deltaproteobacteria bacterium HGW-Deltaproteobacteria-19]